MSVTQRFHHAAGPRFTDEIESTVWMMIVIMAGLIGLGTILFMARLDG